MVYGISFLLFPNLLGAVVLKIACPLCRLWPKISKTHSVFWLVAYYVDLFPFLFNQEEKNIGSCQMNRHLLLVNCL